MKAAAEELGVKKFLPLSHGNAWSIYFNDPEGNGIEIFCDSPWHIQQPQAMAWDRDKTNDEVLEQTQRDFASNPAFSPITDYYRKRTTELKDR